MSVQDEGPTRAVFVDPTGRRGRIVARACWALGALGVAYVGLILVSLLLPPGLSRLTVPGLGAVLPGPAAAPLGAVEQDAPEVLLAPTARPSPRPSAPPPPRPTPATARPTAIPSSTGSPSLTATPRPTTAATRAPTAAPGRPTTEPTRRPTQAPTTAPGGTRTPKPRPTPTRGPR